MKELDAMYRTIKQKGMCLHWYADASRFLMLSGVMGLFTIALFALYPLMPKEVEIPLAFVQGGLVILSLLVAAVSIYLYRVDRSSVWVYCEQLFILSQHQILKQVPLQTLSGIQLETVGGQLNLVFQGDQEGCLITIEDILSEIDQENFSAVLMHNPNLMDLIQLKNESCPLQCQFQNRIKEELKLHQVA